MRVPIALVCLLALYTAPLAAQQVVDRAADEQIIRQMIQDGQFNMSDDAIFISGAYPKPLVGAAAMMNAGPPRGGERTNFQSSTDIERVVISEAGDMAYVYGTSTLNWEGQKPFLVASVWVMRKHDGTWMTEVFVARPHEEE